MTQNSIARNAASRTSTVGRTRAATRVEPRIETHVEPGTETHVEPGTETRYTLWTSPLGEILLTFDADAGTAASQRLTGLYFDGQKDRPPVAPHWRRAGDDPLARRVVAQLERYFGSGDAGFDVPVGLAGTAFQQRVWQALCGIAPGDTVTYGELARRIGAPRAVRAVGAAIGRNPVSIIVPCHRVVGHDGSLTGYAGGLARKRHLLRHEGVA